MTDSLIVFQNNYSEILGIKAVDQNGNEITYRKNGYSIEDWVDGTEIPTE